MTPEEIAIEYRSLRRHIASDCLKIIERHFNDEMITMKSRNQQEQTIIGGLLTVLEQEIKDEIKQLI